MDDRDRKNFYSSTSDDDDDDLELEPPDAEVLAAEERRGKEAVEASQMAIDIDEVYRDAGRDRSREILEGWVGGLEGFRFRFQVKHLLIATAVLAIVLTLYNRGWLGTVAVLLCMASVIGLYLYLQWQEKKAQDEALRKRAEMYERRRAFMERKLRPEGATAGGEPIENAAATPIAGDAVDQTKTRPPFRFHFSLMELMAAMTVAAVIFGIMHVLGGASNTATVLGFVALIGLVVHALGFEPPAVVALGWWLILVLYVLLSLLAVMWSSVA